MSMTLADDHKALMDRMDAEIARNGGSIEHDLSDPDHREYVKLMHTIAGHDPESFPGLHRMIDAAAVIPIAPPVTAPADEDGWVTDFGIRKVGTATGTDKAAANGYGTVAGGFKNCNLSMVVRDPDGRFLATGSNAGFAPMNTLEVSTDTPSAKASDPDMKATMTYSYLSQNGTLMSGSHSAMPAMALGDPTVTEPKREDGNTNPYNPKAICIGLGRPFDLKRCDYIYNEPTNNHPKGRLPLVGQVTFNQKIKTLQPGTNFQVDIYVIRTDNGGQTKLDATDMNNVYNNFFIDPTDASGKTLAWNLPMRANITNPPDPQPPYNPVVFNSVPWSTEMESYLTVNITATLEDGNTAVAIIQSSAEPDNDPLDGVAYIMPIEFVWHCLGEDTEVTLAWDEGTRNITEIRAGERVMSQTPDGTAEVSVTHVAPHSGEIWHLETDMGQSLVASAHHVFFTPEGPRHTHELEAGSELMTQHGTARVADIISRPGEGRLMWNLSLGEAPHRDDPDPDVGVFYANGILVGDARAERALRYRCGNSIHWVKNQVPEILHPDVETVFEKRGLPI